MRARTTVLFLLVLPVAAGLTFELTELEFIRNNIEIERVSTENPRLASMYFTVNNTDFTRIEVDTQVLSDANTLEIVEPADCASQGSDYRCEIEDVLLEPESESVDVPTTVYKNGESEERTLSYTFIKDNTAPVVNSISTTPGEGHIGPDSEVQIDLSDGPFKHGFIFYYIDQTGPYMVENCESGTCTGRVTQSCNTGNQVTVRIGEYNGVPSQDDAGNPVKRADSVTEEDFTCDTTAPEVTDVSVTAGGDELIQQGEQVELTLDVEDTSEVQAVTNFEALTGNDAESSVTCDDTCTFTFTVDEPGYKQVQQEIQLTDQAGNTHTETVTLEILETVQQADDAWRVGSVTLSPKTINRKSLQKFDKQVGVQVELQPSGSSQTVLEQRLQSCNVMNHEENVGSSLYAEGETAGILLNVQKNWHAQLVDEEKLEMNCTLETRSRKGNTIMEAFENDTFEFDIGLTEYPSLPQVVKQQINESRQSGENWEKALQKTDKAVQLIDGLCDVNMVLQDVSGALTKSEATLGAACAACEAATLAICTPICESACQPVAKANDAMQGSSSVLWSTTTRACELLTCQPERWGAGWVSDDLPGMQNLPASTDLSDSFRPEDSLATSVATACLPGITQNLKEYQQIQCQYQNCLANDVLEYGMPVGQCEEARSRNQCRYLAGQVAMLFPWVNALQNIKDTVKEIITNPFAAISAGAKIASAAACSSTGIKCEPHATCMVSQVPSAVSEMQSLRDKITSTYDKVIQDFSGNICDVSANSFNSIDEFSYKYEQGKAVDRGCNDEGCGPKTYVAGDYGPQGDYVKIGGSTYEIEAKDDRWEMRQTEDPPDIDGRDGVVQTDLPDDIIKTYEDSDYTQNVKDMFKSAKGVAEAERDASQFEGVRRERIETFRNIWKQVEQWKAAPEFGFDNSEWANAWPIAQRLKNEYCETSSCEDNVDDFTNCVSDGGKAECAAQLREDMMKAEDSAFARLKADWVAQLRDVAVEGRNLRVFAESLFGNDPLGFQQEGYYRGVTEFFDETLDAEAQLTNAFCGPERLDRVSIQGAGDYGPNQSTIKASVHVEGFASNQSGTFEHKFTYAVYPASQGDIVFDVVAYGDENEELENDVTVTQNGKPAIRYQDSVLTASAGEPYNQICIEFTTIPNTYKQEIGLSGNSVCSEVGVV